MPERVEVGWHANARDWPAGDPGVTEAEVFEVLAGLTPQLAEASAASLLRAGEHNA